jgi:LPPG:FO 2-phospho-L-lactate transferase
LKVVALAGGVGGAKLVDGLAKTLPSESLTVIVNTGDDFDHLGLRICPDIDTVCYTLAGIANPATGWGQIDESWMVMETLEQLGAPSWFRLGDRDLATHLERSRLLNSGKSLSEVTSHFCEIWNIDPLVIPMSDDHVPTMVDIDQGELTFQDYFVRLSCEPQVTGFRFAGVESANPAPGVLESLSGADIVIICPSNPWVSIDPILAVPGVRETIVTNAVRKQVIAVSPIIADRAVKGPAAKMYQELGYEPSAVSTARHYGDQTHGGLLTGYVYDNLDAGYASDFKELELRTMLTNTLMKTIDDRIRLAKEVTEFAIKHIEEIQEL